MNDLKEGTLLKLLEDHHSGLKAGEVLTFDKYYHGPGAESGRILVKEDIDVKVRQAFRKNQLEVLA